MVTAADWLSHTQKKLAASRKRIAARRVVDAPYFNVVRFLRNDENGLSDMFAYLLNPNEDHEQGSTFLRLFVDELLSDWNPSETQFDTADVRRERPTEGIERRRPIDIVVRLGDAFTFAIESKIRNAADQDDQIRDYLRALVKGRTRDLHRADRSKSKCRLIYLTPSGALPSPGSISRPRRRRLEDRDVLRYANAHQFAAWIDRCADKCQAERVKAFLRDLANYLRVDLFGGVDMTIQNDIVDAAIKSAEALRAALEVAAAGSAIQARVLDLFIKTLKIEVAEGSLQEAKDWHIEADARTVYLRPTKDSRYGLALEFSNDKNEAYFSYAGIMRMSQSSDPALEQEIREVLTRNLGASTTSDDSWWPWWKTLNPTPRWASLTDALVSMREDGEQGLSRRSTRMFGAILKALYDADLTKKLI